jgi:hypothetical protein
MNMPNYCFPKLVTYDPYFLPNYWQSCLEYGSSREAKSRSSGSRFSILVEVKYSLLWSQEHPTRPPLEQSDTVHNFIFNFAKKSLIIILLHTLCFPRVQFCWGICNNILTALIYYVILNDFIMAVIFYGNKLRSCLLWIFFLLLFHSVNCIHTLSSQTWNDSKILYFIY